MRITDWLSGLSLRRALGALIIGASLAGALPAMAAPNLAGLSAEQRATVNKVNAYFNGITTIEGKFVQTAADGAQSTGYFVIDRPGKMRFRYYPPTKLDIIADGKTVAIDDQAVQEQTMVLLSETPLRFLLDKNIDLTNGTVVQQVTADEDLITVQIEDVESVAGGRLTLIFDARSIELKQWSVIDSQGLETTVALYEVKIGAPTNPKWFEINYKKYK